VRGCKRPGEKDGLFKHLGRGDQRDFYNNKPNNRPPDPFVLVRKKVPHAPVKTNGSGGFARNLLIFRTGRFETFIR